ncbi:RNA processing protein [Serendipita sp. 401]|nr:RNA processing protein [Serendipita sp. 401]
MMVELKNGESFNGHLIDCDTFMNITLREVYQTAADSERFWKLKEVYIRGSTIKYLQVQPALLDSVKEEQQKTREAMRNNASGQRGGRGANRGGARGGGRVMPRGNRGRGRG